MNRKIGHLREFGKFRLDARKRVLWFENSPVQLAMKEIEMLCVLTEHGGEVVTKNELLERVWNESFVEESNLSRHIYILRKTFKNLGAPDLIQTLPRAGYRFTGDVREVFDEPEADEFVIEHHAFAQTLIEDVSDEEFLPQKRESAERLKGKSIFSRFSSPRSVSPLTVFSFFIILLVALVFGFARWRSDESKPPAALGNIKSIAVMPFSNVNLTDDELLAKALTDSVTANLGKYSGLIVRPVKADRNEFQSVHEIARTLGADAVLQGSFYHETDEKLVTVQLQLLRGSDGELLWEETIRHKSNNLLALQTAIATAAAEKLISNLTDEQRLSLQKKMTHDEEAFQAYLKGNFYLAKRSLETNSLAVKYYNEAIARAPRFALAYVGLADAYAMTKSPAPEAEVYLEKALELDPELAEAHASLGFIRMFQKWDWAGAESSLRRAVELDPNSAKAHQWLATFLAINRRFDEAETEIRRALEIEPTSSPIATDLCEVLYFKRDFAAAQTQCEAVLGREPYFPFALEHLTKIYFLRGDTEKATGLELNIASSDEAFKDRLKSAFRQKGIRGAIEIKVSGTKNKYQAARLYAQLGDRERALQTLESEVENHAFLVVFANADPIFDELRDDARFQTILRKMNLN